MSAREPTAPASSPGLGAPRLHLRRIDSTNQRARDLAAAGAVHGTLVTASEQTAGRGRQGRRWLAPPGQAVLMSLVLRRWPRLLPLAAGVAVAQEAGSDAAIKWPNDVLVDGRKAAGILVEGRPQEGWMVLGIGVNVAVDPGDLPPPVRAIATGLERPPAQVEPTLCRLLARLEAWLSASPEAVLAAVRERDALAGQEVTWAGGSGTASGIDDSGRLLVRRAGVERALESGEVHLQRSAGPGAAQPPCLGE